MTTTSERLYLSGGAATIALTATPWLSSEEVSEAGVFYRDVSLWGMLGVVRESILPLAVLGTVVILAFGVACVVLGGRTTAKATSFAVLAWLATATVAIIMALTDGGFRPGIGAWVTIAVTSVVALTATVQAAQMARARTTA